MDAAEKVQWLIDDLDRARSEGTLYTHGMVQEQLWHVLTLLNEPSA